MVTDKPFLMRNLAIQTDSYKAGHFRQYPPGTSRIMSYLESRGGMDYTIFFGLQYIIKKFLIQGVLGKNGSVINQAQLDRARKFWDNHFGDSASDRKETFNWRGWQRIIDTHDGRLPIRIRAVPEGTKVPQSNVLMTVENTDPECYWLTNWLETLLVQVWYPTTIATNSHMARTIITQFLEETGDPSLVDFKLHDFGYRGVTCDEQAGLGGMAHLTSFMGTDTVKGIVYAMEYYNSEMCGFSIPASEHSTMTSWGKDHELDAFKNMLNQHPTGLVACVSDSFDIYHACAQYWGTDLKDQILNRDGTLVVRPDSGDPVEVTRKVFEILWDKFGGHTNDKGFRVLDPHIRMIQGDGIDLGMLTGILATFKQHKISADNIAFGSGGGLLQQFNRDTARFAFKCCLATVDGEDRDVFKSPIAGVKPSKKGYLSLVKEANGSFHTVNDRDLHYSPNNLLEPVFENGEILREHTFEEIRERIKNQL